jgi:hypothetical protein
MKYAKPTVIPAASTLEDIASSNASQKSHFSSKKQTLYGQQAPTRPITHDNQWSLSFRARTSE